MHVANFLSGVKKYCYEVRMDNWKDRFIIYTLIALMCVAFVFVVLGLDKHNQPSIEDVMTNNATSIEELLE